MKENPDDFLCQICKKPFKEDLSQRVFQNFIRIKVYAQQLQQEFELVVSEFMFEMLSKMIIDDLMTILVYYFVASEWKGNPLASGIGKFKEFMLALDF